MSLISRVTESCVYIKNVSNHSLIFCVFRSPFCNGSDLVWMKWYQKEKHNIQLNNSTVKSITMQCKSDVRFLKTVWESKLGKKVKWHIKHYFLIWLLISSASDNVVSVFMAVFGLNRPNFSLGLIWFSVFSSDWVHEDWGNLDIKCNCSWA